MLALVGAVALLLVIAAMLVVGRSRPEPTPRGTKIAGAMLAGALWAVAVAFPLAAVCALVYRFPMPMAGYSSGTAAVPEVFLAVVFYGLLGGFPALLVAGAAAGAVAYGVGSPDPRRLRWLVPVSATVAAALAVGLLVNLDRLIGPW